MFINILFNYRGERTHFLVLGRMNPGRTDPLPICNMAVSNKSYKRQELFTMESPSVFSGVRVAHIFTFSFLWLCCFFLSSSCVFVCTTTMFLVSLDCQFLIAPSKASTYSICLKFDDAQDHWVMNIIGRKLDLSWKNVNLFAWCTYLNTDHSEPLMPLFCFTILIKFVNGSIRALSVFWLIVCNH